MDNLLPAHAGNRQLCLSLLQFLKSYGIEVTLLSCYLSGKNPPEINEYVDHLYEIQNPLADNGVRILNKLLNCFIVNPLKKDILFRLLIKKELTKFLSKKRFDYIIFNYLKFADILPKESSNQTLLFTHDIVYQRYKSLSNRPFKRLISDYVIKPYELDRLNKFFKVLVVADYEKKELSNHILDDNILNIGAPQKTKMLPVGQFEYYFSFIGADVEQNVESIEYFLRNIYLDFRDKTFAVAGKISLNPSIKKMTAEYPNIKLLGFVDDLEKFYTKTRFVVGTIISGSGIKIKILEAMSFGKVVIATEKGLEGIHARHLKEVININQMNLSDITTIMEEFELTENYSKVSKDSIKFIQNNYSLRALFGPLADGILNDFS